MKTLKLIALLPALLFSNPLWGATPYASVGVEYSMLKPNKDADSVNGCGPKVTCGVALGSTGKNTVDLEIGYSEPTAKESTSEQSKTPIVVIQNNRPVVTGYSTKTVTTTYTTTYTSVPILFNYRYVFGSMESRFRFHSGFSMGCTLMSISTDEKTATNGVSGLPQKGKSTDFNNWTVGPKLGLLVRLSEHLQLDFAARYCVEKPFKSEYKNWHSTNFQGALAWNF